MKAVVEKPFPFAEDGVSTRQVQKGDEIDVPAGMVAGLESDGYIKRVGKKGDEGAIEADRITLAEIDRVLAAASDGDLKSIIARSGRPYSGNLVHAKMVEQAKAQLVKEATGEKPKSAANPDAGVTEQPLSKPGEATPPSAKTENDRPAKSHQSKK